MFDFAERITKLLGILVACFGVFKYYDSLDQKKIDRTVGYFDEYHSGSVFEARKELGTLSYEWINIRNRDGTRLAKDDFVRLILQDLNKIENRVMADTILEFFDRIVICVRTDACDRETALALFDIQSRQMAAMLTPLIIEKRQVNADRTFASGLLCLSDSEDKTCLSAS